MEEWRDIEGYEGLYQVSNEGRVKSLERYVNGGKQLVEEKIKSVFRMSDGYYGVNLYKDGTQKLKKIARLVAETFIPNPTNLPEVNHKNEDKALNTVENLEWCDRSYNINYGTRNKRVGDHYNKKVCKLDLDGKVIFVYDSLTEASRDNNVAISRISNCCNNKPSCLTGGGFKWKFYE